MQFDIGSTRWVGGVAIRGRTQHAEYVEAFLVEVSLDGETWMEVDSGATFRGSSALTLTRTENRTFKQLYRARLVRLRPQAWRRRM